MLELAFERMLPRGDGSARRLAAVRSDLNDARDDVLR